ncbi:DNA cytosine methyltransferase [Rothia dentocariosa]|uniref:DNA cytosine methyltransferase n=1 Tax=Rothia dentocariosa TaxID=2047 RepID=UPI00244A987B|nr:DNA (cytosine-5-)-methyltransferase [Rothia dentocariosa]
MDNEALSKHIKIIDLFTGAGGLTAGAHYAAENLHINLETVAAVELDPDASATYKKNFNPKDQYIGDIDDWLNSENIPSAELIIGGPPCQGFSSLGKQNKDDPRNILWKDYVTTIYRSKPKYFVLENVPPFLKSREYQDLLDLIEEGKILESYIIDTYVLNAANFGVAQNRKRAILIGRLKSLPKIKLYPLTTNIKTIREVFEGIPRQFDGVNLPQGQEYFSSKELHLGRNYSKLSLERFASIPPGGNRFDIPDELLSPCWKKHTSGSADVMGRLHWDSPSVTIRTEFFKPEKGRYLHPTENRAITHFEAARIQGFPDDFMWYGSKVSIAKQIGNAVPVKMAQAILTEVLKGIIGNE